MLLSVIVPIINTSDYLKCCVTSIIYSSHKDTEILLISGDSSETANDLAKEYANIKVIDKANRTISELRNIGLEKAHGRYIAFVDCNDYIHKDMFKFLAEAAEELDADIIECGYQCVYDSYKKDIEQQRGNLFASPGEEAIVSHYLGKRFNSSLFGKLYRSEILQGIKFDTDLNCSEDLKFNLAVLYKGNRFISIDNQMYYYRQRTDSTMSCYRTMSQAEGDISVLNYRREIGKQVAALTEINNLAFVGSVFIRIAEISKEKRKFKYKKDVFNRYVYELIRGDDQIKSTSLMLSNWRKLALKILKYNRRLACFACKYLLD